VGGQIAVASLWRMSDFDGTRVGARALTDGFAQAYGRFQSAQTGREPTPAFFALFEALNWAHAVDDVIAKTWSPRGKVEGYGWRSDPALAGAEELPNVMSGLRYARNRVHHQWADALILEEGRRYPHTSPRMFFSWVWRQADELPTPPDEGREAPGREAYTSALAGRKAQAALAEISRAFTFIGPLLDPPIPVRQPPTVHVEHA